MDGETEGRNGWTGGQMYIVEDGWTNWSKERVKKGWKTEGGRNDGETDGRTNRWTKVE